MFFTRVIAVFCGVALFLAIAFDALLYLLTLKVAGIGFFAKSHARLMLGWFVMFAGLWIASLVIGWFIAKKFHIWPLV